MALICSLVSGGRVLLQQQPSDDAIEFVVIDDQLDVQLLRHRERQRGGVQPFQANRVLFGRDDHVRLRVPRRFRQAHDIGRTEPVMIAKQQRPGHVPAGRSEIVEEPLGAGDPGSGEHRSDGRGLDDRAAGQHPHGIEPPDDGKHVRDPQLRAHGRGCGTLRDPACRRDVQCAQCHDHPHVADYKQAEYFGLLAFVNRLCQFTDAKQGNKLYLGERADGELEFSSVFKKNAGKSAARPGLPMAIAIIAGLVVGAIAGAVARGAGRRCVPEVDLARERRALARLPLARRGVTARDPAVEERDRLRDRVVVEGDESGVGRNDHREIVGPRLRQRARHLVGASERAFDLDEEGLH